jgi:hypothetical protein
VLRTARPVLFTLRNCPIFYFPALITNHALVLNFGPLEK